MITINGIRFYDEPSSCGTCEFLVNTSSELYNDSGKKHCPLFDEWHHSWANPPRRCAALFKKAFAYPDGSELVIIGNKKNEN